MLPISDIVDMTNALARANHTVGLLPSVVGFLRLYYSDFQYDYIPCKNPVNGRFKKGKLEELLIYLFAEICNWSNSDRNLRDVHEIMKGLGYQSYEIAARRYRQMIENAKKEMKQNPTIRNRIRALHSKVKNHKNIICKEYSRFKKLNAKRGIIPNLIVTSPEEPVIQHTISEDNPDSSESTVPSVLTWGGISDPRLDPLPDVPIPTSFSNQENDSIGLFNDTICEPLNHFSDNPKSSEDDTLTDSFHDGFMPDLFNVNCNFSNDSPTFFEDDTFLDTFQSRYHDDFISSPGSF